MQAGNSHSPPYVYGFHFMQRTVEIHDIFSTVLYSRGFNLLFGLFEG
jgi:hypothetical protein